MLYDRLSRVIRQRQVIKGLVVKNLKDKYVGSTLGILWAVINPLLIMLAVNFVFSQIMKTEIKYYSLLVLSALLPWNFILNSITESTTSMIVNASLLKQFVMPKEAVPIAIVIANFVNFLFGILIVLPFFIFFNLSIAAYLPLLPVIIILHFAFTLGVSLLFSVSIVHFKDLPQLLNTLLMFLFWMTPIFYSLEMIPEKYHWFILANPGSCYVLLYRAILYHGSGGTALLWVLAGGFALVSFIIGYKVFLKNEQRILKTI